MDNNKTALLLLSSPRKDSNSTILGEEIAEGYTEAGGTVERTNLAKLKIGPCRACEYCKGDVNRYCVIDDDMEVLYPTLVSADALIIASPIYWFHISAQLKLCMDRWYALNERKDSDVINLLKGKRFALAFTFGDEDPVVSGAVNAYRSFADACSYIGIELIGTIYGRGEEAGIIRENEAVLHAARELGRRLFQSG